MLVEGMNILFSKFDDVTKILSGEKYPTLAHTYPYLCVMFYHVLNEEKLFDEGSVKCSGSVYLKVLHFQKKFLDELFYDKVVEKLRRVQRQLAKLFTEHFSALDEGIIWIYLLDPRMRQMRHLKEDSLEGGIWSELTSACFHQGV